MSHDKEIAVQRTAAMYHEGEIAVQARVGVRQEASRIGNILTPLISAQAKDFLQQQSMVVVSTVDAENRVWVSLLTGESGFMQAVDSSTIEIAASPRSGDPLNENLQPEHFIGMIAIDMLSRKRLRINGSIVASSERCLRIRTEQVYVNCPKYIQQRILTTHEREEQEQYPTIYRTGQLTERQQAWIRNADTFFIGSVHAENGADASHRGGNPGFVHIIGKDLLLFPDYTGNKMFQTFGNLVLDPHAGLLFIDFERGWTLQLTGKASIIWDEKIIASIPGANRLVLFEIASVVEIEESGSIRGQFLGYSPFNPS